MAKTLNLTQNRQEIREGTWLFSPIQEYKGLIRESHILKSEHLFKFIGTLTEDEDIQQIRQWESSNRPKQKGQKEEKL